MIRYCRSYAVMGALLGAVLSVSFGNADAAETQVPRGTITARMPQGTQDRACQSRLNPQHAQQNIAQRNTYHEKSSQMHIHEFDSWWRFPQQFRNLFSARLNGS